MLISGCSVTFDPNSLAVPKAPRPPEENLLPFALRWESSSEDGAAGGGGEMWLAAESEGELKSWSEATGGCGGRQEEVSYVFRRMRFHVCADVLLDVVMGRA